jgi:DNA-binding HxlR family transcriptional regulator
MQWMSLAVNGRFPLLLLYVITIKGISNKMLSKELKDLEMNKLVKRTVLNTQPITVQYELTEYGMTLKTVISYLSDWGIAHRKKIIEK